MYALFLPSDLTPRPVVDVRLQRPCFDALVHPIRVQDYLALLAGILPIEILTRLLVRIDCRSTAGQLETVARHDDPRLLTEDVGHTAVARRDDTTVFL